MNRKSTKSVLPIALGVGVLLALPTISHAGSVVDMPDYNPCQTNCDQPPTSPPPVVVLPPQIDASDNEDNRRKSALVSCCLRQDKRIMGMGAYCSAKQLETAIKRGDLISRMNPDGSRYCAEGTGVVVSQTAASGGNDGGQGLASPFQAPFQTQKWTMGPLESIARFLTGPFDQSR